MSFYMTLPSDSSKKQFPDNRIGNYTTALARDIALESNYEVGLSEILLPAPKSAVTKMQFLSFVDLEKPERGRQFIGFPPECFLTFTLFQRAIRKREYQMFTNIEYSKNEYEMVGIPAKDAAKEKLPFGFTLKDRRVILTVGLKCDVHFTAAYQMTKLYGFINNKSYNSGPTKAEVFTGNIDYTGANNMDLVYVYCDLVEYGIVGDTLAPCLRTIPITARNAGYNDQAIVERFENPHYVPVQRNVFSAVNIVTANDNGEEIKFAAGVAITKLHFRPKKR